MTVMKLNGPLPSSLGIIASIVWLLGRLLAHLMDGSTGGCCQLGVNESHFKPFFRELFPFCVVLKCKNRTARVVAVLKVAHTS